MSLLDSHIRPIDNARAARIVLGLLDDDLDMLNRALMEANRDNTVHLLIASLAGGLGEVMVGVMGEDNARATLHRSIVEALMSGEATDGR